MLPPPAFRWYLYDLSNFLGMKTRFARKLVWLLPVALVALAATTRLVSAHAYLVRADPAPNSVVTTAPKQVTLWFDETVDPNFSAVQVLDADQSRLDQDDLTADPGDSRQIHISLKPLPDGTYTVVWRVLSATDGHITRGVFAFGVGKTSSTAVPTGAGEQSGFGESDPASVLVRWINLLSILTLVGALFFRDFVWMRSPDFVASPADARWKQLLAVVLGMALIAEMARLVLQARLATETITPEQIAAVLFDTRIGTLWMVRWVALTVIGVLVMGVRTRVTALLAAGELGALVILYTGILGNPSLLEQFGRLWTLLLDAGIAGHIIHIAPISLFVLVVVARDKATRTIVTYLLTCGVLLTLALGSHSAGQGDVSLAVLADWLHLAAVSAWIGGLVAFVWIITPAWRALPVEARRSWLASLVSRFSSVALASVLVIIATGIYTARLEIPGWDALFGTLYGRTLDAKLVLFSVLLVMGGVQLLWMRRRIGLSSTPEQATRTFENFRRLIFSEAAGGIIVIGLAGFLTLVPPARSGISGQPISPSPSKEPSSLLLFADPAPDLHLSLAISPSGRLKTYDALVTDANKHPAPDLLRVVLEFTLLDQDVGATRVNLEPGTGGHYTAAGDWTPLPGMWRVRVIVRRKGVEDVTAEFPYYVPAPSGAITAGDPQAMDWLEKSDAAMNHLTSLRSVQELNDGAHGEVTTRYEYRAPDRMRMQIAGEGESIAIGPIQYYLEQGVWQAQARVNPLVFPNFANARQAGTVRVGRAETRDGKAVQVVLATGGALANVHYAYWIGSEDFRLYEYAMVAPAHFMIQSYSDFDAPVQIAAPVEK